MVSIDTELALGKPSPTWLLTDRTIATPRVGLPPTGRTLYLGYGRRSSYHPFSLLTSRNLRDGHVPWAVWIFFKEVGDLRLQIGRHSDAGLRSLGNRLLDGGLCQIAMRDRTIGLLQQVRPCGRHARPACARCRQRSGRM